MDACRSSGQRGKVGKGRTGSNLGMKTTVSPTPPAPPASSFCPAPPAPPSSPLAPAVPTSSPAPTPDVPSSFPSARTSSPPQRAGVLPRPAQGVGFGATPPNFPSEQGNQHAPNLWAVYPPGGFTNLLQRPQYTPHPHMAGENFHWVGQNMSFNPISPPPPPSAYGTVKQGTSAKDMVNIDSEEGDNSEANRAVKKRYWTHDEETRLASAWLNVSKDPIRGNDKKFDTFWKEITEEFNRKGNGKRRREMNQLKVHWSRLKSSITDFNDCWTKVTQVHTSGYSDDMLEEEAL